MRSRQTTNTLIASSILWFTCVHMAAAACTFVIWRVTGNNAWIDLFFKYPGCVFFMACATAELGLAWYAFRQFSQGEPLRAAWLLITIASFYRLTGLAFSHVLGIDSKLNPLYLAFGTLDASLAAACRSFGLMVCGPMNMAVLAAGLFLILRTLRRLGLVARLRPIDLLLVTIVAGFTIRQLYEIIEWLRNTSAPPHIDKVLGWAADPLLSALLFEAILIRRSALETGWGLLSKSWGAFAAGIFLTSLVDMGLWATAQNYLPWPYSSLTWYVWFLASAAFALGPAYQVEACRRAVREARAIGSGLSKVRS
ncbi:MAG TPA: hypothetical protein VE398_11810 [Acidobacteriota bacterium]|nr:hypothetical protein [Acidobacteriota bacterium]